MIIMTNRVVLDPEICHGKPTIKGTRVLVSIILEYLEEGTSFEEIIDAFPSITTDDIKAAIRYAKEVVEGTYFDNYTIAEISS